MRGITGERLEAGWNVCSKRLTFALACSLYQIVSEMNAKGETNWGIDPDDLCDLTTWLGGIIGMKCHKLINEVNGIMKGEEMPTDGKKNALAKLAETLKDRIEHHGYVYDIHRHEDIIVQRIVAELAKVEDVTKIHNLEPVQVPNIRQCYDAIVKSREIAEEGAGDGK